MTTVFDFYYPGLWEAVRLERLEDVRRLVNIWCKTDISRDLVTLREMAVSTGNESLCRIIPSIIPSMVRFVFISGVCGQYLRCLRLIFPLKGCWFVFSAILCFRDILSEKA